MAAAFAAAHAVAPGGLHLFANKLEDGDLEARGWAGPGGTGLTLVHYDVHDVLEVGKDVLMWGEGGAGGERWGRWGKLGKVGKGGEGGERWGRLGREGSGGEGLGSGRPGRRRRGGGDGRGQPCRGAVTGKGRGLRAPRVLAAWCSAGRLTSAAALGEPAASRRPQDTPLGSWFKDKEEKLRSGKYYFRCVLVVGLWVKPAHTSVCGLAVLLMCMDCAFCLPAPFPDALRAIGLGLEGVLAVADAAAAVAFLAHAHCAVTSRT